MNWGNSFQGVCWKHTSWLLLSKKSAQRVDSLSLIKRESNFKKVNTLDIIGWYLNVITSYTFQAISNSLSRNFLLTKKGFPIFFVGVYHNSVALNTISNIHQDLEGFPTSVVKMIFMSTFLIISCFLSSINGQELPDQKFVTDLVTNFNRFGIIYHLPLMKRSHIHNYYKSINQYK